MKTEKLLFFVFILIALGLFYHEVNACGCGIAISDMKVFNSLKETQAYLLIDVKNKTEYDEAVFFNFISLDRPNDVTIVFPTDKIPYNVEGKKISAKKFLEDHNIYKAEDIIRKLNISEFVNHIDQQLFALSNGLILGYLYYYSITHPYQWVGVVAPEAVAPIAHFEFEGGTLDIYNISSTGKLEEFVKKINIPLADKVKELVTKYKDYYIAVLRLKVPSVINENDINFLENCMPDGLERIKDVLSKKTEFKFDEIDQIIDKEIARSNCGGRGKEILRDYIYSATYASEDVEGILVVMKFKDSSNFFYPISIVNSYKYPIKDQRYYIKVPDTLHIRLSSSKISKTANFEGERWYKVELTKEDIKGEIVEANFLVKLQDTIRNFVLALYDNPTPVVIAIYVLIFVLPLILLRRIENLTKSEIVLTIVMYLLGGLLASAIVMFTKKKKKLAFSFLFIWILLLVILIK